jgi:hypothetical protein
LPSSRASARPGGVEDQPAAGVRAQPATQCRVVAQRALGAGVPGQLGLAAAGGGRGRGLGGGRPGAGRGDPGQLGSDPFQRGLPLGGVPVGLVGVVAEHPAQVRGGVQADLLDPQVVPHGAVAAPAGEHLLHVREAGTQPFPGDDVPAGPAQPGRVRRRGEPAVDHGDHPASPPGAQVVLDLRQHRGVVGVARPAPPPHRNALPGHRRADDDLRQAAAGVLGVPVPAKPRRRLLAALGVGGRVFGVALEVGAGGVEEQQV